jgi:photosystem II stability/assembly factor-like uncharacterized protein
MLLHSWSPRRSPRPVRAHAASLVFVLVAGFLAVAALPGRAESPCVGSFCWVQRGNYSAQEFTTLQSPPGNPCVVAFTGLSNNGLDVSTDCGSSFARLLFLNAYDATARDTNVGYVAGATVGVAKTKDTGSNWFLCNNGLPGVHDVRSVVIHYAHPESAFCALYGGGVFIGGPTGAGVDSLIQWTAMNEGLFDLNVRHFVRVRGGSFMLAAADGGIFQRGASHVWNETGPGLVANQLLIDSADSSRCYAACEGGFYRSLNYGQSWFPSNTGLPPSTALNCVARRTDNDGVLYVGTRGQGVFESVDYGATWRAFGPAVPGENDVRALLVTTGATAADSAGVFAGTRTDGLYETAYSTPASSMTWGHLKDLYRK